jgi:hypothetical protein
MEERFPTTRVRLCVTGLEQGKLMLAPDDFPNGLLILNGIGVLCLFLY